MRPLLPIALLLLAGCVNEKVGVTIRLDTTACAGQALERVEAYVLRVEQSSLCVLSSGSSEGGTGEVVLRPGTIDDSEVVVLALAYGAPSPTVDGGTDVGPGCGDGQCDPNAEDCQSCPQDCGPCPGCGDGQCDPSTESCQSCPQDCGSCQPTGPNSGQLCDQNMPCPQGDVCAVMQSGSSLGMCVASCQIPGGQCPTATPGTQSVCGIEDPSSNTYYCVYVCEAQGQTIPCPQGLTCQPADSTQPNTKICLPPGPDAGPAGVAAPCVVCHGLARIKLGEQGGRHDVALVPTAACRVPPEDLKSWQLPVVPLPPGDC